MAYTNFTNCTEQEYLDIIYSQDDRNRIKIWFNNVELSDAGEYCESLTGTNRILPSDGSKRFSLNNFIAKEYDLVLRDLPAGTVLADQVRISIGTLVDEDNDTYEDVPIGIFNIQDTPTTDKNKVTIKLRDNRIKFDFNYNAKPLMDLHNNKASYMQILNDMCSQAGVTSDVSSFSGDDIEVSIYDNSIKATTYVSYIAEQAGAVPVITREGHLDFIYLNDVKTWRIPLSIVEKYEIGTPFTVERVVYESGIIKYETDSDETLETLYLDGGNMYVSSQEQVEAVFDIMEDFTLDSATTGKILGNPAIDPYDFIEIYNDEDENEPTILKTLANNSYTFNGVHRQTFSTTIGKEERKENVTKNNDESFKNWARTEINNLDATVLITTGKVDSMQGIVIGTYELTTDTDYEADKNYYIQVGEEYILYPQYKDYEGERVGSPHDLGLYEATTSETYTLTDDTTFEGTTAYYTYNSTSQQYELYTGSRTGNPHELGLYEKIVNIVSYSITNDTEFLLGKEYYIKQFDIGDTIPEDTIYELKNSILDVVNMSEEEAKKYTDSINSGTVTNLQEYVDSAISVSKGQIELGFNTKYGDFEDLNDETNDRIDAIHQYLKYVQSDNSVHLGSSADRVELVLKNNKLYFWDKTANQEIAYFGDNKLYITRAEILTQIQIGKFAFTPRTDNDSLSFKKVA